MPLRLLSTADTPNNSFFNWAVTTNFSTSGGRTKFWTEDPRPGQYPTNPHLITGRQMGWPCPQNNRQMPKAAVRRIVSGQAHNWGLKKCFKGCLKVCLKDLNINLSTYLRAGEASWTQEHTWQKTSIPQSLRKNRHRHCGTHLHCGKVTSGHAVTDPATDKCKCSDVSCVIFINLKMQQMAYCCGIGKIQLINYHISYITLLLKRR